MSCVFVCTAEGVIVVGATNRLDMIDPALLRPGRFDHVVHVPLPDAEARHAILKVTTRHMPLAEDVDLFKIAHASHSYTGFVHPVFLATKRIK